MSVDTIRDVIREEIRAEMEAQLAPLKEIMNGFKAEYKKTCNCQCQDQDDEKRYVVCLILLESSLITKMLCNY